MQRSVADPVLEYVVITIQLQYAKPVLVGIQMQQMARMW